MYGLTPMTLAQEVAAPAPVRSTRNCKVNIQDDCFAIIRNAEAILEYAQRIPEDNDPDHARRVIRYAEGIHRALLTLTENEGNRYE